MRIVRDILCVCVCVCVCVCAVQQQTTDIHVTRGQVSEHAVSKYAAIQRRLATLQSIATCRTIHVRINVHMHAYVDERTALGSSRDVGTKKTLTGRIRRAWRAAAPMPFR
ncbi:hypothetical protein BDP55DRAFT_635360 [Colletotrichum godetiae]|uniref:Secreted protein n=1 Tax=Colletotrichum godetiae TaxID=1209918 RepID=A0AAJ0ADL5_9PEZI|nr:uncharacterized protein BDP55DRAFT_635360 [Colletotrichum godetiae]KAK1671937.1 hypothetical protein BDP55DRAFT_635360 [Colletotrichum godetiae]